MFTGWCGLGLDTLPLGTSRAPLCSCTNKHCEAVGYAFLVLSSHNDICWASAGILNTADEMGELRPKERDSGTNGILPFINTHAAYS
jgi:hypothetical protein